MVRGMLGGLSRGVSALLLGSLAIGGCTPQPQAIEANNTSIEDDGTLAQQRTCIANAINETVLKPSLASSYPALEDAFRGRDLTQCPQDFVQAFVTASNALHLLNLAQDDLRDHLAREQEAKDANTQATLSDAWNGKPSGSAPLTDWMARKGELETLNSRRRQAFEEARAALLSSAAQHGLAQSRSFLGAPDGVTAPDVSEDMVDHDAQTGNTM